MIARVRIYTAFPGVVDIVDKKHLEETGEVRADVSIVAARLASGQRPDAPVRCPVLLFKLMQACWVAAMDQRPKFEQVLGAVEKIAGTPGALDAPEPPADSPTEEPEPEPEESEPELLPWLSSVGFEEHEELISNYVSESTALADLRRMLEVEQEDEEEEDLKDLVAEMELDAEEAARFRDAIGSIAGPEPEPEPEPQPEPDTKELETMDAAWSGLVETLELEPAGTELERAHATIAELRAQLAVVRTGAPEGVPP